ncbi:MAG: hypothetical protein CFE32_20865, partial [Alphaproteobacteria bacterium PA3]
MSMAGSKSMVLISAKGGTPQGVFHFARSGFTRAAAFGFAFAAKAAEPVVKVKVATLPAKKSLRSIVYTSLTKQETTSFVGHMDGPNCAPMHPQNAIMTAI